MYFYRWKISVSPASRSSACLGTSMSRNDRGLDLATALYHHLEYLRQSRQRHFARDVVGALDLPLRDQRERLSYHLRRVMERRLQRDLRVVQPLGVELHLRPLRASAKEVHRAAFARHVCLLYTSDAADE